MKKILAVLCVTAFAVLPSQAQIEKFPGETAKAFGTPVKEGQEGGSNFQVFAFKGLSLKVTYTAGKASKIQAWKTEDAGGIVKYVDLSAKDLECVLTANANGTKWIEAPPGEAPADIKRWSREDGKAKAEYSSSKKMMLVVAGDLPAAAATQEAKGAEGGKDWTPIQFSLTPGHNWPGKKKCNGLKIGIISGGGYLAGIEGAFACCTDECDGIQGSFVNMSDNFQGIQGALVNVSKNFSGAQFGIVNLLKAMGPSQLTPEGLQFGAGQPY